VNIQGDKLEQLLVVHFREQHFATLDNVSGQVRFLLDQLVDLFLDRAPTDEFMNENISFLADAKGSVGCLVFDGRVPPAIEVNHLRGGREIQPRASGFERKDKEWWPTFTLKILNELPALGYRRATVQDQPLAAENGLQESGKRFGHFTELSKDERFFLALR
jgi:hypothetical protein